MNNKVQFDTQHLGSGGFFAGSLLKSPLQNGLQQVVTYSSNFQKDLSVLAVSMDGEL